MSNHWGVDDSELREVCIAFCKASRGHESCTCARSDKGHYCDSLIAPLLMLFSKSGVSDHRKIIALMNGRATIRMKVGQLT